MKIKQLLLAVPALAALLVSAQTTRPRLDALQSPSSALSAGKYVVIAIGSAIQLAVLDSSLTIDATTVPATLRAVVPSGLSRVPSECYVAGTAQTVFTIGFTPAANTLTVYKNGVRYFTPNDWTATGTTVTWLAGSAPVSGDSVCFDYSH